MNSGPAAFDASVCALFSSIRLRFEHEFGILITSVCSSAMFRRHMCWRRRSPPCSTKGSAYTVLSPTQTLNRRRIGRRKSKTRSRRWTRFSPCLRPVSPRVGGATKKWAGHWDDHPLRSRCGWVKTLAASLADFRPSLGVTALLLALPKGYSRRLQAIRPRRPAWVSPHQCSCDEPNRGSRFGTTLGLRGPSETVHSRGIGQLGSSLQRRDPR